MPRGSRTTAPWRPRCNAAPVTYHTPARTSCCRQLVMEGQDAERGDLLPEGKTLSCERKGEAAAGPGA